MPSFVVVIVATVAGETTREDVERAANWHGDGLALALGRVADTHLETSATVKVIEAVERDG